MSGPSRRDAATRLATLGAAVGLWLVPPPEGLSPQAWHLFAIFAWAIVSVVAGAFPILTASVFAVAAAVLTGTLAPEAAYTGFANPTILLIVVAFLVSRAVVTSGLGERMGYRAVSVFGKSTLGLSYSIFVVDAVIAPAFPSNTARSGVLYPLTVSVAEAAGAEPRGERPRLGRFLMFSGIASISLSSGLWLTAMAANPIGAEIARNVGVQIGFGTWLVASSVPTLLGIALLPLLLYKVTRPEVTATPRAPEEARRALAALGPATRDQKIVAAAFFGMVVLWAAGDALELDATAVALLGLAVILATRVLKPADIARQGQVLATYIWFAALFSLSNQLDELGFMGFVGEKLAGPMGGMPPLAAGGVIVVAYVLLHYLFVSQTAHLLAVFAVFLGVGVKLGVPAAPLAFQLLFATNYFSAITPQGSSANLLFAGSGYLSPLDIYRLGGLTAAFGLILYLLVGTPWLMLVTR